MQMLGPTYEGGKLSAARPLKPQFKDNFGRKLSILQRMWSKKGQLANLRGRKGTLSGPHICTHLSTKY